MISYGTHYDEFAAKPPAARRPPTILLVLLAVTILLPFVLIAGVAALVVRNHIAVPVTVSADTTRLTGPVRADGSVDYLAALNRQYGRGATPENNAAVLLWQALGAGPCPVDHATYFGALGMSVPRYRGDYFVSINAFAARQVTESPPAPDAAAAPAGDVDGDNDSTEERDDNVDDVEPELSPLELAASKLHKQLDTASGRPWKEEEFAELAQWLQINEKPLAIVVEATRRPRLYAPRVAPAEARFALLDESEPLSTECMTLANALLARAMLRVAARQVDQAWDDLTAAHRLSMLVLQSSGVGQLITGMAINERVCSAERTLLVESALERDQLARMRADLETLMPHVDVARCIDSDDRYVLLDTICALATCQPGEAPGELEPFGGLPLNWNLVLKRANVRWDSEVAGMRLRTRAERVAALSATTAEMDDAISLKHSPVSVVQAILSGRRLASERVADFVVLWLSPDFTWVADSQAIFKMDLQLTKLSFALAAYKTDHGRYPRQLDELVPEYAQKVPDDFFAAPGVPIYYRLVGEGCDLQGVGPDGVLEEPPESHLLNKGGDQWWGDDNLIMLP